MAVTVATYNSFKLRKLDESAVLALVADNIRIILTTSSYTPDAVNHVYRSSVTNEVANGLGYTTGGQLLAGKSVGWDGSGLFAYFDANDVAWSGATFTARRAVIFKDTGNAATSPLIGWIDFGVDKTGTGGAFTIRWAASSSGALLRIR
jgi:hypothetical protein